MTEFEKLQELIDAAAKSRKEARAALDALATAIQRERQAVGVEKLDWRAIVDYRLDVCKATVTI